MSYGIGQFVGAIFGIALLCLLLRFVFKRFLEGTQLILTTVACAVAVATFAYAFGSADGGEPQFGAAFAQYGIGGAIVLLLWLVRERGRKERENG
ncbi:MAG: hypothetical protein AAGE86_09330 [Pseudomonadota bacterium]